jgi:thiol:disulfide interchange protein DsbD
MLRLFCVLCLALVLAPRAAADAVRTEHVEAQIVPEQNALVPGTTTTVALRLRIDNGWHTYWRNPGDSGLPTTLAWKLPPGFSAGDIQWPAPKALPAGPLVNYGYEGEVLHLVPLTVPQDAAVGSNVTLPVRADWLVCRETCIPDGADLSLTLPIAASAAPDAKWSGPIVRARAALPRPLEGWKVSLEGRGQTMVLKLGEWAASAEPGQLRFFAFDENRVEPSSPQPQKRTGNDAIELTLPVSSQLTGFTRLSGVLTSADGLVTPGGLVRAAVVDVPLTGSVTAGPKPKLDAPALNLAPAPASNLSLAAAALLAFAGGLILNLMPCVFPVLSLKALSLAGSGQEDRRVLRWQGAAFALGIVVTFIALAGLLLALRATGEELGWGFQLQSPAVVTALAVLFFMLALNLSGVFEFASLVPASAGGWTVRNPYLDAALSGVLAVVIASPCTAPFMGAALGYAIAQPLAETLAVFVALGVGMAVPFTLLNFFPRGGVCCRARDPGWSA